MTATDLLPLLHDVRSRGSNKWMARCPAHNDRNPSLSISQAGARTLLRCFGGCETLQIVAALGLRMCNLFTDTPLPRGQRLIQNSPKIDRASVAFRFDLAALDRWLRAERVLKAVAHFGIHDLDDKELDQLMEAVACAHRDQERAKLLETVADDLRVKGFKERTGHHAA